MNQKMRHSEASKKRLRKLALKQWRDKKARATILAAVKKANKSPLRGKRISQSLKEKYQNDKEYRKQFKTKERKANMLRAQKIGWRDPARGKRQSSLMKRLWKQGKFADAIANHPNQKKYRGLDKAALPHFGGCHGRVACGKVSNIAFPRTREGYIAFCKELGPKPRGQKWSVGRKNHGKGYVRGNIKWQILSDNVREMRQRVSKGT
jgi:hypothetical protein